MLYLSSFPRRITRKYQTFPQFLSNPKKNVCFLNQLIEWIIMSPFWKPTDTALKMFRLTSEEFLGQNWDMNWPHSPEA